MPSAIAGACDYAPAVAFSASCPAGRALGYGLVVDSVSVSVLPYVPVRSWLGGADRLAEVDPDRVIGDWAGVVEQLRGRAAEGRERAAGAARAGRLGAQRLGKREGAVGQAAGRGRASDRPQSGSRHAALETTLAAIVVA